MLEDPLGNWQFLFPAKEIYGIFDSLFDEIQTSLDRNLTIIIDRKIYAKNIIFFFQISDFVEFAFDFFVHFYAIIFLTILKSHFHFS